MHIGARDLLRKLGAGVRPAGVRVGEHRDPFEARSFDALLDEVRRSGPSGRAVGVATGLVVEVSPDELEWLGEVGDAAERGGLGRVLAFLDGRTVELDVRERRVVRGGQTPEGVVVTGAEAVAVMRTGDDDERVAIDVVDAQDLHGTPDARGLCTPLASLDAIGRRARLAAGEPGPTSEGPSPVTPGVQEK